MARKPVNVDLGIAALRPQAQMVDMYVEPGASPLRGLAESLRSLRGTLATKLDERDKKKKDEDKLKGEAQFYKDNAEGFAEGVRTDRIPANASKDWMDGYGEASGYVAGGDLRLKFNAALDEALPSFGDDPGEYDKFVAKFISENIDPEAKPSVLKGLLPQVKALHGEGYSRYTDYRSRAVYAGNQQAHGAIIAQEIDKATADGLSEPGGTDYGLVTDQMNTVRENFVKQGGRYEDADKLVVDVVTSKAAQLGDKELLKVLETKIPGQDYTYADTEWGRKSIETTLDAIDVQERRAAEETTQKLKLEMEVEGNKARSEIQQFLTKDPNAPIPEELMARARKYDDTIDTKVLEWRRSINTGVTDKDAQRALWEDLLKSGGDTSIIDRAIASGVLGGREDIEAAHAWAEKVKANEKKLDDLRSDAAYKDILYNIEVATQGKNELFEPIKGDSPSGMAAKYDFEMAMVGWALRNPDATLQERLEVQAKVGKAIMDRIQPPADPFGSGVYVRPDTKSGTYAGDNPYAQPPAPGSPADVGAPPPAQEQQQQGGAEPTGTVDPMTTEGITPEEVQQDAQTFIEGMTPEQLATVGQMAKDRGMSLEEFAKAMVTGGDTTPKAPASAPSSAGGTQKMMRNPFWSTAEGLVRAAMGASDGETTADGMSYEAAMDYLNQALALSEEDTTTLGLKDLPAGADPEAHGLIQLILQHEAAGNWNAVYGNAKSGKDLGQMTLNQVLATQLAARRRGAASTAIGGPQFLYKTLKGLKSEFGLSGNEKFTPELQMKLMQGLLDRRGWQEYKAGKISQRQFARRLSQEWASLPNPDTGKSYYAGDGLNASRIKPSAVYAALGMGAPPTPGWPFASDPYANIPDTDGTGAAGQKAKFLEWNADPVGNHEAKLGEIDPTLAEVVKLAQTKNPNIRFVVGSGKRDKELQKKAKAWGWSKTEDSDHLHGGAVDLWGIDKDSAVTFDKTTQKLIVKSMKAAAAELGVELDVGADWKGFEDMPHFAVKKTKKRTKR